MTTTVSTQLDTITCLLTLLILSLGASGWWYPHLARFLEYWYHRNIQKGPSSFTHALHVTKGQKIVRLGRNEFSITDPALVGSIYGDKTFRKSDHYAAFDVGGQVSLFSVRDEEEHGRRVKAVRGLFRAAEVARREDLIRDNVGRTIACIADIVAAAAASGTRSRGEGLNVLSLMRGYAVETISQFALGTRYLGPKDLSVLEVGHQFGLVLDDINNSVQFGRSQAWIVQQYDRFMDWYRLIRNARSADSDEAGARRRELEDAHAQYTEYCHTLAQQTARTDDAEYKTRLEIVGLSEAAVHAEISDLLFAGTDSTATTLSTALWYIYRDDTILERVRDDLEYVEDGQLATRPYLNAVLDEALRLAQPVPRRLPRVVPHNKDMFYAEDKHDDDWQKILPAGAIVGIAAYSLHRDPVFDDAEVFRPERWLQNDPQKRERMRSCFVPFGRGHRACIGQELARSEMRLVLRGIVEAFDGRSVGERPTYVDNFNASILGSNVSIHFKKR